MAKHSKTDYSSKNNIELSARSIRNGRPTYHIVKLDIKGNCFMGDAAKCFKGQLSKEENLKLAEIYWENNVDTENQQTICEMLVDGQITVVEIVKEINANIKSG